MEWNLKIRDLANRLTTFTVIKSKYLNRQKMSDDQGIDSAGSGAVISSTLPRQFIGDNRPGPRGVYSLVMIFI